MRQNPSVAFATHMRNAHAQHTCTTHTHILLTITTSITATSTHPSRTLCFFNLLIVLGGGGVKVVCPVSLVAWSRETRKVLCPTTEASLWSSHPESSGRP